MAADQDGVTAQQTPRRELAEAPPFLSWSALYVLLAALLALEIGAFALITRAFR